LRIKLKSKVFGAKLTLRLVVFFTMIAVLPGILIYAVSVQFLDKSIESWFDVRVEKALEGGLNLGRSGLDNSMNELTKKAQFTALLLAEKAPGQYQSSLNQMVDEAVAQEAALFTSTGSLAVSSSRGKKQMPDVPDKELIRLTLDKGKYSVIDTLPGRGLTLRSLVMVNSNKPAGVQYVLQFI
jgi:nitrogen fixation/metabolism regulation signal transduction histidine kinase